MNSIKQAKIAPSRSEPAIDRASLAKMPGTGRSRRAVLRFFQSGLFIAIALLPWTAVSATKTGRPIYMKLPTISFSLLGHNRNIERIVSITLALELKSEVNAASMRPFVPRILERLLPILESLWQMEPRPHVSIKEVKDKVMPAVVTVFGDDKVEHVLVLDLHERSK